ncbi:MAG: N-acetylmuramoyl-L-alanine amidase [Holophaga sp.]|nr:N-acetylmuramoyl-L-alanine amidase [Holophaga sp.]
MKLLRILPILALLSLPSTGLAVAPAAPPRLLVELDPGHGGEDDGAKGRRGLLEKDVALDLANDLAEQLAAAGMEARLTRRSDVLIPLWDRARKANADGADLFISLHLNADPSRQAKGSEVYFLSMGAGDRMAAELAAVENAGGKDSLDPDSVVAGILSDLSQKAFLQDSERLAVAIQAQLNLLGGIKQRGVKQAPFVVLRGAAMPAVLVETAFISNPREEARLMDPAFRKRVAQAIARGVRRYFAAGAAVPRRRTSIRKVVSQVPE